MSARKLRGLEHGWERARGESVSASMALNRRGFLVGAGMSLVAATSAGRLIRADRTAAAVGLGTEHLATGLGGNFEVMARAAAEQALEGFDQIASVGSPIVRFPVFWDRVQVSETTWDWSGYESLHEQIVFHGLQAMPVLMGPVPRWAFEASSTPATVSYPIESRSLELLGRFALETVRYFDRFGDHLCAIEVWNSPNSGAGGVPDVDAYGRMLSTVLMLTESAAQDRLVRRRIQVVAGSLQIGAGSKDWSRYMPRMRAQPFPFALGLQPRLSAGSEASQAGSLIDMAAASWKGPMWITDVVPQPDNSRGADFLAEVTAAVMRRGQCRGLTVGTNFGPNDLSNGTAFKIIDPADGPTPPLQVLRDSWS